MRNTTHKISFTACLCLMIMLIGAGSAAAAKKGGPDRGPGGYMGPGGEISEPGGYTGPGPELTSIKQALGMDHDVWVSLKGKITRALGGPDYMFSDGSGETRVKIGGKVWQGRMIGPDDTVELRGKVKRHWNDSHIDVKQLITQ